MRIGVISDTHMRSCEEIPPAMVRALSNVDLIIHAGDIVTLEVLEELRRLGEVKAVRGNMDSAKLRALLPEKELIVVGGKKIGITHGWGSPQGIEERVRGMFDGVDVIIYGHSHKARNEQIGGILFFNPGEEVRWYLDD
jgi:putative phosphoesterase